MTQEENKSIEVLEELVNVLRLTVANQQLEIVDLKALLNISNAKLESYKTLEK